MSNPTVEELVALLSGDDSGEDEGTTPAVPKGNPVSQLREQLKVITRELKDTKAALKVRDEALNEYTAREEASVFETSRLNERQRALFKAVNPEAPVTTDAITTFVTEYGITVEEGGETETVAQDTTPAAEFKPTQAASSAAPGLKRYSPVELAELAATDPAAAQAVWQAGRLDTSGSREGLGPEK
jgi:hypothetical protein